MKTYKKISDARYEYIQKLKEMNLEREKLMKLENLAYLHFLENSKVDEEPITLTPPNLLTRIKHKICTFFEKFRTPIEHPTYDDEDEE